MAAISACLLMAAMVVGSVSFGYFMEPVTSDLGFDRAAFSLYFTIVTVVGGISLPVYGRLIPKVGVRKIAIVCGALTGVFMACTSLCTSLPMFYGVALLIGTTFFGCSYASMPVIVSTWFHEKTGFIIGCASATGGILGILSGFFYPSFIANMGWQAGYVLLGAIVAVLTVPTGIILLRNTPEEVGLRPYGCTNTIDETRSSDSAAFSGVTMGEAFRMPSFWAVLISLIILAFTVAVTQHLAAYFVSVGFDGVMAGIFMSVISGGLVITNILIGMITDKLGVTKTLILSGVLYMISFAILPLTISVPVICVSLVLMSLGNGYVAVLAPLITQHLVGTKDYAAIWGVVSMVCVLGQGIGSPIWGLVYDLTGSYNPAMFGAAIVVALCSVELVVSMKSKGEMPKLKAPTSH